VIGSPGHAKMSVHTNVFFLELSCQVALEKGSTIRRAKGKCLESPNTLTNVVFPVPPSPTTRRTPSRKSNVNVVRRVMLDHGSIAREDKDDAVGTFGR
jgi:hypothetical protein